MLRSSILPTIWAPIGSPRAIRLNKPNSGAIARKATQGLRGRQMPPFAVFRFALAVLFLAACSTAGEAQSAFAAKSLVHKLAPQFVRPDLDNKRLDLKAYRGKVVLLNFWATWCPPCRREMPDMEKLYQRFSGKGLVVLAVSDEKRETVEDFLKKQNYTFPVLLDSDRKVNAAFGIEGIPNSFLFDRQGKLVAQSIDMRTERQFLEMFQTAGLE